MREPANNPVDEAVGARIRLLRKRRKISQEELGKAIGVTFQQVQKYRTARTASAPAGCIWSLSCSTSRSVNSSTELRGPVARRGRQNQSRLTGRRFASPKPSTKSPTKSCARRWSICGSDGAEIRPSRLGAYSACFRVLQALGQRKTVDRIGFGDVGRSSHSNVYENNAEHHEHGQRYRADDSNRCHASSSG